MRSLYDVSMDIDLSDVDWSRRPVLAWAEDADGNATDDMTAAADGGLLLTMRNGDTVEVSFARALAVLPPTPVRVAM